MPRGLEKQCTPFEQENEGALFTKDQLKATGVRGTNQRLSPQPQPQPLKLKNDHDYLPVTTQIPVGARLQMFLSRWKDLVADTWVHSVVQEGLRISFREHPPLTSTPVWTPIPKNPEKAHALRQEVQSLLEKRAIIQVQQPCTPGFFSILFLVKKPRGWRPVIDLSRLNLYIEAPPFRMETSKIVKASVLPNDFAISIDLTDAYLHVPMHSSSLKFLRFAIDGKVYCFRALPFGLNIAPWAFTRVMDSVMVVFRKNANSVGSNYLDDLLQKNQCRVTLLKDRDILLKLLVELGFLINKQKSDLKPSQEFCHLGMCFHTAQNRVFLPEQRAEKIIDLATNILKSQEISPRLITRFIGQCNAAAELIPLGHLRLRPIQWELKLIWSPVSEDWDCSLPLLPSMRVAIHHWLDRKWLVSGVPLSQEKAQMTLFTDASRMAWGAHILPLDLQISQEWTKEQQSLHINALELLAIKLALSHWKVHCRGKTISLFTDNTTVVAYIRNQGGLVSWTLFQLVQELLLWTKEQQITLMVRHIPGKQNVIADSLSRSVKPTATEWSLNKDVFESVLTWVGDRPHIDLFATRHNNKLPTFVSPVPDPLAWAVDAFAIDWTGFFAYAYPPAILIPKLLNKMQQEQCTVVLVAPMRWNRIWFSTLLQLLTRPPIKLPCRPDLLTQKGVGQLYQGVSALNLHVWVLSSMPCAHRDLNLRLWRESLQQEGLQL